MATREDHIDTSNTYGGKIQPAGFTSANLVEVETNTNAMRVMLRPAKLITDWGRYQVSRTETFGGGNQTSASNNGLVFTAYYSYARGKAVIKRVWCNYIINTMTANLAGTAVFQLWRSRNTASIQGTGLGAGGLGNNIGCLDSRHMEPGLAVFANTIWTNTDSSNNAATDTVPIGVLAGGVLAATAGQTPIRTANIYEQRPNEPPLELTVNMEIELKITAPGATTAMTPVVQWGMVWEEFDVNY